MIDAVFATLKRIPNWFKFAHLPDLLKSYSTFLNISCGILNKSAMSKSLLYSSFNLKQGGVVLYTLAAVCRMMFACLKVKVFHKLKKTCQSHPPLTVVGRTKILNIATMITGFSDLACLKNLCWENFKKMAKNGQNRLKMTIFPYF